MGGLVHLETIKAWTQWLNLSRFSFQKLNWNTSYFQSRSSFGIFSGCLTHNTMSQVESFVETWLKRELDLVTRAGLLEAKFGSQTSSSHRLYQGVPWCNNIRFDEWYLLYLSMLWKMSLKFTRAPSRGESCYAWLRRRRWIRDDVQRYSGQTWSFASRTQTCSSWGILGINKLISWLLCSCPPRLHFSRDKGLLISWYRISSPFLRRSLSNSQLIMWQLICFRMGQLFLSNRACYSANFMVFSVSRIQAIFLNENITLERGCRDFCMT